MTRLEKALPTLVVSPPRARAFHRFGIFASVAIFAVLLLIDRLPRFYQGDSVAYLSTGMNNWIPPDRSWAYGFGSRWLVEITQSASALVIVQSCLLLGAMLLAVYAFCRRSQHYRLMLVVPVVASLDPINQAYTRFWLSDTAAEAAFVAFMAILALSLTVARPRLTIPALVLTCLFSVFIRVAYAPMEIATLLIATAAACLTAKRRRAPGLVRRLLALTLLPVIATGCLAAANSQVSLPSLRGKVFLNQMSGLYTMAVFLPGLRYEDFVRAGVAISHEEFDGLDLGDYDNRPAAVWGSGPRYVRAFLQQKLDTPNVYDERLQRTCSAILRSALLHHPQTILAAYLHGLLLYFEPSEWTTGFQNDIGYDKLLPDWVAAYLTQVTHRPVSPRITLQHSLLPDVFGDVIGLYPFLLLIGLVASGAVLIGDRQFGARHILAAAIPGTLLVTPIYSHAVIPRYLLATVMLSEILLLLLITEVLSRRLQPRPTQFENTDTPVLSSPDVFRNAAAEPPAAGCE